MKWQGPCEGAECPLGRQVWLQIAPIANSMLLDFGRVCDHLAQWGFKVANDLLFYALLL